MTSVTTLYLYEKYHQNNLNFSKLLCSYLFTDNVVKVWDTRKPAQPIFQMAGHNDTVTGMSLSPDGAHVLTNSMDNTLRVWDIRPYASKERCVKLFTGHLHNFEKVNFGNFYYHYFDNFF